MNLTLQEAAERLGVSRQRVQQLIYEKKLRAVKFGMAWILTEAEVERFKKLDRPAHRPAAEA